MSHQEDNPFRLTGEDRMWEVARFWWQNRGNVSRNEVLSKDLRGGDKAQLEAWMDAGVKPEAAYATWTPRPNHLTATAIWDPETETFTEPFDGRVWSAGGTLLDAGTSRSTTEGAGSSLDNQEAVGATGMFGGLGDLGALGPIPSTLLFNFRTPTQVAGSSTTRESGDRQGEARQERAKLVGTNTILGGNF